MWFIKDVKSYLCVTLYFCWKVLVHKFKTLTGISGKRTVGQAEHCTINVSVHKQTYKKLYFEA